MTDGPVYAGTDLITWARKGRGGRDGSAGMSGKWRAFGRKASAESGDALMQAGPAVALWGDDEVQEGVGTCSQEYNGEGFGPTPRRLSLVQGGLF